MATPRHTPPRDRKRRDLFGFRVVVSAPSAPRVLPKITNSPPTKITDKLPEQAKHTVGLIEALSHHRPPVKRLLEQALTWQDADLGVLPATSRYRIARQLRQVELDDLVEGYRAGKTVFQLAHQFGIDRRPVGKHLRKRGIDTTPPGLRPNEIPTAVGLYREGWSLAQIGNKYGIADTTVRTYLLKEGVVMRARKGGRSAMSQRALPSFNTTAT